jgi:spore coat polysaccharide biosynthesis protein SpsF
MSNTNQIVGAIVQARMGSTRLPGKTLIDIGGKPLLGHVLERVAVSRHIQKIVVATTSDPADDVLADYLVRQNVRVYRGSAEDVLDRYYQAARLHGISVVVRVTADDPFKEPCVIDRVVEAFHTAAGTLDYASNTLKPSYPEGLDVEVFSFSALERALNEAELPFEREHVTPYIWMHPERFRLQNIEYHEDLSALRWTLDTPDDLEFTRRVYGELYHGKPFHMDAVIGLLRRRPELVIINAGHRRLEAFWNDVAKRV